MTKRQKITSTIIGSVITLGLLYSIHKPLSLVLMDLVDYVGYKTSSNVVEIIDFLNTIYYL